MVHFTEIETVDGFTLRTSSSETAILGTWIPDSIISFRPAVPLRNGHEYRLMLGDIEYLTFTTPHSLTTPQLMGILPNRDTVPSNLLKISLVFSERMTEHGGVDALSLYDLSEDREIQHPFLEMTTELWSDGGDTLTVWIDPGRIKRDLIPNKTLGPVLLANHEYEIRVSPEFQNSNGVRIDSEFTHQFYASEPDRKSPDPNQWRIISPHGPKGILKVEFNEVLNPATIPHYIEVQDINGKAVDGILEAFPDGSGFQFDNLNYWKTGEYIIYINIKLEDLSGNQIHRLFDNDNQNPQMDLASDEVELRFMVN